MIALRERAAGSGRGIGRMAVSVLAFGSSLWAIAGAGQGAVFWGFLLLIAGLPVYVAMRWRGREESPAETAGE